MKGAIGFVFTESFVKDLEKRGFAFCKDETNLQDGYRSFRLIFADSNYIEIREVFDEQVYLQRFQISHFEPTVVDSEIQGVCSENSNTVMGFRQVLTNQNVEPGELRTYLQIRKVFPLWALWLTCQDFQKFCEVSHPERVFDLKDQKVALIHLGPNCFDLLISSK